MDLEDFLEPEVAVAAVVTAAIVSPRGRKLIRRGAVYGLAGVLMARDAVASFASGVRQGAQEVGASAAETSAANIHHRKVAPKASAEGAGE